MKYLFVLLLSACTLADVAGNSSKNDGGSNDDGSEELDLEGYRIHYSCAVENGNRSILVDYIHEEDEYGSVLQDDITCEALEDGTVISSTFDDFGVCSFSAWDYQLIITGNEKNVQLRQIDLQSKEKSFLLYCEELEK